MEMTEGNGPGQLVSIIALVLGILASLATIAEFLRRGRRKPLWLGLATAAVLVTIGAIFLVLWPAQPDAKQDLRPIPSPSPPIVIPTPTPDSDTKSEIVYRTPSGERYHRADCRFVKGKAIPLTLAEAKESGLTPCKICRPPA
jgi:hypothetical protein